MKGFMDCYSLGIELLQGLPIISLRARATSVVTLPPQLPERGLEQHKCASRRLALAGFFCAEGLSFIAGS